MARRHRLRQGDETSIVARLEELVLTHSGVDGFDAIAEVVVAKLYAERRDPVAFRLGATPTETLAGWRQLRERVAAEWPGCLAQSAPELEAEPLHLVVSELAGLQQAV